jgi:flagellar motor protein MotB
MLQEHTLLESLIRWGYQPLAVAKDAKHPLHTKWSTGKFNAQQVLQANPSRFALRMGDKGLQAIDIDSKNAKDPKEFLQRVRDAYASVQMPMDKLIIQRTVSDGVHLIYRTDTPKRSPVLAADQQGKTLIEIRGEGACIMMYDLPKFEALEHLEPLTSEEVQLMIDVALSFDDSPLKGSGSLKEYNLNHSCIDLLVQAGWTVVNETSSWTELLRDGSTTSRTSGKVFNNNRAYIWSTSTPLPSETSLSPADITCHLHYGGDFRSFTKSLGTKWTSNSTLAKGNLFKYRNPNDVITSDAVVLSKPLLGELWQERELGILFGPTNVGKSILAVEIGDAIASGGAILSGFLSSGLMPTKVLYLDFEMSDEQFKKRFLGRTFSENFSRIVINEERLNVKSFRQDVFPEIEYRIDESNAKVLIIDNLSFIQADNTNAGDAATLILEFKRLKDSKDISILIVGHTPKFQKGLRIESYNLYGSAQLVYFIDSLFAINKAVGNTIYIKQLKQRVVSETYGEDNVLHCKIEDTESGLQIKYLGNSAEWQLLDGAKDDLEERNQRIVSEYLSGIWIRQSTC